jgi:hypothetical protein
MLFSVIQSYTLIQFIIRQQGHQLRKHHFSQVYKLVYDQFLVSSNRKIFYSLARSVFIGHYEDRKKVNGTQLI